MHITKDDWAGLLEALSGMAGRKIPELHTRDFYAGNGVFRGIEGPLRARIISRVFEWLCERKHHVIYASVCKESYFHNFGAQRIPDELNTPWRFLGFHTVLAVQKHCQGFEKNKGNTIFIFDNEEREKLRFTDVIMRPPQWSDEYYDKKKNQKSLNQVVDAPYFADSQDVGLIQLADFCAFFLRRYAEIKENLVPAKYHDEGQRIDDWIRMFLDRSTGTIYKRVGRNNAEQKFFENASVSIRAL